MFSPIHAALLGGLGRGGGFVPPHPLPGQPGPLPPGGLLAMLIHGLTQQGGHGYTAPPVAGAPGFAGHEMPGGQPVSLPGLQAPQFQPSGSFAGGHFGHLPPGPFQPPVPQPGPGGPVARPGFPPTLNQGPNQPAQIGGGIVADPYGGGGHGPTRQIQRPGFPPTWRPPAARVY